MSNRLLWAAVITVALCAGGGISAIQKMITSTYGAVIPAVGNTYEFVEIENQSDSAFVYCVWSSTSVTGDTAGQRTTMIAPLGGYVWNPPPANQALYCNSSADPSPVTVRVY